MYDPVIQRNMTYFYDVHGNLHITIKPDLTKALDLAEPKFDESGNPLSNPSLGGAFRSEQICLDINYAGEVGDLTSDCDIIIKRKSKALAENLALYEEVEEVEEVKVEKVPKKSRTKKKNV